MRSVAERVEASAPAATGSARPMMPRYSTSFASRTGAPSVSRPTMYTAGGASGETVVGGIDDPPLDLVAQVVERREHDREVAATLVGGRLEQPVDVLEEQERRPLHLQQAVDLPPQDALPAPQPMRLVERPGDGVVLAVMDRAAIGGCTTRRRRPTGCRPSRPGRVDRANELPADAAVDERGPIPWRHDDLVLRPLADGPSLDDRRVRYVHLMDARHDALRALDEGARYRAPMPG